MMNKFLVFILALYLAFGFPIGARAGTLYDDGEIVISDTAIYPKTDGGSTVGKTGNEFANGYFDSLVVGGSTYASFAAGTDGNWTGNGLTTTLDSAPTAFIATHATGDFAATGFTVGTGDFTFAQGAKLDGDTNGTVKIIEASDTLSLIFSGSTIQLDSSDGGFQFGMTSASEGQVDFLTNNDTDDYLSISTASNVPTITTSGTSNLGITPDGGTVVVTGAVTASGLVTATGGVTSSTTITLQNAETIGNATNGTVTVSGTANPIVDILDAGTSDSDATLQLTSDAAGDNGDIWQIQADGGTQDLLVRNNTTGSQATWLTIADTTGLITTAGDLTVTGTTPLVTIGDGGDEDAGIQIDSNTNDFYIASENSADDLVIGTGSAIGTTPIISMTDTGVTTITGSTDGDLTVYGAGTTASDAYIRLVGDADTDATDAWQLWNDSSGASLIIGNDSSVAGTYITKLTLNSAGLLTTTGDVLVAGTTPLVTIGDAGAEDNMVYFVGQTNKNFSVGTDATDDTFVIAYSNTLGTDNRIAIDDDANNTKIVLGDGASYDHYVVFDGASTADYYMGYDHTGGASSTCLTIGAGSVVGTTPALNIDTSANVTITNDVTFRTSLVATGRVSASTVVASSVTNLAPANLPYCLLRKGIGFVAGEATTLPNGTSGQVLSIMIIGREGGSGTWIVTPTTSGGWTSLTFDAVGGHATLLYVNDLVGWIIQATNATIVTK